MKTDIHPKYFEAVDIVCSCGAVTVAGSTKEKLKTELCSSCHPFFTGKQKLLDTAGRVDKFQAKRKKAVDMKEEQDRVKEERKKKTVYVEKEVSEEVLARAMSQESASAEPQGSKWEAPLGDAAALNEAAQEVTKVKKPPAKGKKTKSKSKAPKAKLKTKK